MEAVGPSAAASAAVNPPKASSTKHAQCRLQLRLPTGSPLVSTFNSDQLLSDVVDWLVQQPDAAGLARNSVRLSSAHLLNAFRNAPS